MFTSRPYTIFVYNKYKYNKMETETKQETSNKPKTVNGKPLIIGIVDSIRTRTSKFGYYSLIEVGGINYFFWHKSEQAPHKIFKVGEKAVFTIEAKKDKEGRDMYSIQQTFFSF